MQISSTRREMLPDPSLLSLQIQNPVHLPISISYVVTTPIQFEKKKSSPISPFSLACSYKLPYSSEEEKK